MVGYLLLMNSCLQGKDDQFLEGQLFPDRFVRSCAEAKIPVTLRKQEVRTEEGHVLNIRIPRDFDFHTGLFM